MDRRTFVLLTRCGRCVAHPTPSPLRAFGNLRFDLDDQRRLSLWYNAPDRSIPLLRMQHSGLDRR